MIFRISYNCKSGRWGHRPRRMPRLAFPPTERWEKALNEAVHSVRKQEVKYCEELKNTKYWRLKSPAKLSEYQKDKLSDLIFH